MYILCFCGVWRRFRAIPAVFSLSVFFSIYNYITFHSLLRKINKNDLFSIILDLFSKWSLALRSILAHPLQQPFMVLHRWSWTSMKNCPTWVLNANTVEALLTDTLYLQPPCLKPRVNTSVNSSSAHSRSPPG